MSFERPFRSVPWRSSAAIETTSGERRERLEEMLAATIKRLVADFADEVMFVTAAEAITELPR
jgi:hypothetical protein